jgi:hypothetical protein
MAYTGRFGQSDDYRREELIRIIEHSVENLTLTSKLTEPKESHQGMITDVKAILK